MSPVHARNSVREIEVEGFLVTLMLSESPVAQGRRTSQLGRPYETRSPLMQRQIPVLGNEPLPTGEKTPRCS